MTKELSNLDEISLKLNASIKELVKIAGSTKVSEDGLKKITKQIVQLRTEESEALHKIMDDISNSTSQDHTESLAEITNKKVVIGKVHSNPLTVPQGINLTRSPKQGGAGTFLATGLAYGAILGVAEEVLNW
jgi:superfamily II helicase